MTQFLLKIILIFSSPAFAGLESTSTLPKGVRSPEFSFGVIDGLSEKFNSSGDVVSVTDSFSLNLTGQNISKFYAPAAELVAVLNNLSPANGGMGNQLSLGTIEFKANPTISYTVINPAYGVKDNLAVGFGFPIINYRNEMEIVAGGVNNVASIQSTVGGLSTEVQNGLQQAAQLSANLPLTVQNIITAKGYKPISSMEYSSIGDTQVYARYRYYDTRMLKLAVRPYVLLPTGRGDDPDDLADYAIGGYTGLGAYFTQEYYLHRDFYLSFVLQYQVHIPDKVEKRVPASVSDVLPGIERKESVRRATGSIYDMTMAPRFKILRWLGTGAYYNLTAKDPDTYYGDRDYNYSLLSRDTGSLTHKWGAFIEFSTTDLYFDKKFSVPFSFGYTFSNTFSAVNSPKTTAHVLNLRMFF